MNKALKIGLIIGGVGVSGVAIYFIYKAIRKAIDKGNAGDTDENTISAEEDCLLYTSDAAHDGRDV
jgi:hypothetical protein